eukprot:1229613-Amphidinium_carterae.1
MLLEGLIRLEGRMVKVTGSNNWQGDSFQTMRSHYATDCAQSDGVLPGEIMLAESGHCNCSQDI